MLQRIGRALKVSLGVLFAGAILWCIVYRVFLGITPLWLDEVTIGATIAILLVGVILKLRDRRTASSPQPDVADPTSGDAGERL